MSATYILPDANVRSQSYYVARTIARCRHCGRPTRLLALAMPCLHETLDVDTHADAGDRADPESDAWQRADFNAFLFYVGQIPDAVQSRLTNLAPFFRLVQSAATQNVYWANHCEQCGRLLDDHDLHCEPDGAFVPTSDTAAANIHLMPVAEQFEAVAEGYSFEPEFFGCMRQS